jgi:YVTN family beta-propeller protein
MLSEHTMEGMLEGYLLTGRNGFLSSYEAFVHVVGSMFNQHAQMVPTVGHIPSACAESHAERIDERASIPEYAMVSGKPSRALRLSTSLKVRMVEHIRSLIPMKNSSNHFCRSNKRHSLFIAVFTLGVVLTSFSTASAEGFAVIKKIPIPGQGSWDYLAVDEGARRLYVSHGTQVEVLDVDSGAIVGKIENTPGVHGIAIAAELGRGFVSNGQASTVTIFDLKTLKTIAEVPVGKKPDAIIYDPATSRVFVFNGASNSATAIQAADGKVAGTVDLGGGPEFAVSDGSGYVYNNLEDDGVVLKINARTLKVEQRWPTAPCASPSSMAMDRTNRRLFVGCRSKVMAVINADNGKVIATLPIGDHVDATAFDTDSRLIFNSNGEGTITVIHQDSPDKYSVVENVTTLPKARTMALDPKTHRLFLSTAEAGQFEVLVVGHK